MIPELNIGAREVPDNEALRFTRSMGVGWNLGNTLEAYAYKGYNGDELGIEAIWCGTMTTEGVFDALKAAGMNTVRIPVSWHDHVDENLVISEAWLERVAEVASWGYERGMHVIINIHHDFSDAKSDTTWIYPTEARYADSERYVRAIWQQVAERFRDWDDRLILESMNEPRLVGTSHEWMYVSGDPECEEAMECINRLNQVFVDTVRATGGYNATRYLMVPAYDASPECAVENETFCTFRFRQTFPYNSDCYNVRYQSAGIHVFFSFFSQLRALLYSSPEHITGGDMGNFIRFDKLFSLSTFSGTRRSH